MRLTPTDGSSFTVRAHDWNLYSDRTVTVHIIGTWRRHRALRARRPSGPRTDTSVYVRWDEPDNTGPPTSYRLRYRHA